ncbi:HAD family hydrolase [Luedemannella helvata]|uniref:HAD family hydrolase n=1 Tax=Luedemannella helvata TaxID=349315 RepID=A0ABN2L3T9_9ACTN
MPATRPDHPSGLVVVFDVDDTLYLERDYVRSGLDSLDRLVSAHWGRRGFGRAAWRCFLAGHRGDLIDRGLAALGIRPGPGEVARLVTAYREHRPRIALAPDAARALRRLSAAGATLAVVTDGPAASQEAKVRALGLDRACATVIVTDRYGPGFAKPHHRAFDEVMHRHEERRWCYVADNPAKDFAAPRALGWRTVRVRRPGGLHAHVPDQGDVDVTVADLAMLDAVLGDPVGGRR